MQSKRCKKCLQVKAIEHFHKQKINSDGYQGYCKECRKEYVAANKEKIKARMRAWELKTRYDIDAEIFSSMQKKQRGCCAICLVAFSKDAKICIDHSHKTGKIRGLLCNQCNVALGMLKDDVKRMYAAIAYICYNEKETGNSDPL